MGGVGSGGRRTGAGRKPKSAEERRIAGNAGKRGRVLAHPSAPPAPIVPPPPARPPLNEEDAPNDLSLEERQVWLRLAVKAREVGTLTEDTADYFKMFCRVVCLEEKYSKSVMDAGSANHRGLIQRAAAMYKDFNIAPFGKPVVGGKQSAAPPIDPLKEKYFGTGR